MDSDYTKALELALEHLRRSDRFGGEVVEYLQSHGFSLETATDVVERLRVRRIVDDHRTAANLIRRWSGKRAMGQERMRAELTRRGAPEDVVDAALAALAPEGEKARMIEALGARYGPSDSRARAARFLLSKGFSEDLLEEALNDFFGIESFPAD